jgi:sugar lactone lactonase YvrE
LNQLSDPEGLYLDEDQTIYIADSWNHRIVKWKCDATSGQVVAGGNGGGNRLDQLNAPIDVIVDKQTDSLVICDFMNSRVMRWSRRNDTSGEPIISDIKCWGLTMDDQRFLYVTGWTTGEVRRYRLGETSSGTVVAGGNGEGDRLNQLNCPAFIFVDRNYSMHVADYKNHRIMKWVKNATEGIVVAGGQGEGYGLTQLSEARGVTVDLLGTVYVADYWNHRIMRWYNGATQGDVVAGGNDYGKGANQFNYPRALSFDRHGNLYVVDKGNNRVQRFNIE